MFNRIYGVQPKWPYFVRLYETDKIQYQKAPNRHLVLLPDGRKGLIDHTKLDGMLGVRPVDDEGNYLPNPTKHWSMEDRLSIPEEISISSKEIKHIG